MKKLLWVLLSLAGLAQAVTGTVSFSKNLSAVDSAITVDSRGYNSISFQLSGTWSATAKFEGTANDTTWTTVYAVNQNGGAVDSVATANGVYLLSGNGFSFIRARITARSSGTMAIRARANEGSGVVSLLNQSSAGAATNVAVTASVLPTLAATSTKQSDGTQKTQLVDGSNNVIGATSNALDVNIKSGASSGTQYDDDAVYAGDGAKVTMAGVVRRDANTTLAGADGDVAPLQVNAAGALKTDGSAVTQPVSGTVTANAGSGTMAVSYATTGSGTATGALRVELPTNGTGVIATVGAVTAITNALPAGTNAIGKLAANSGVDIGDVDVASVAGTVTVGGVAAHDAAISGAPVRQGLRAITSDYTAVATGDVADAIATVDGKQVIKPHAVRGATWAYAAASGGITNTTAATMKAAAAAGFRNCLTGIQVINGHATVSTEVLVRDGAAGTVVHRGWAQAAGGGYAATFDVPICGTAATLMEVVPVTTGSAIYVNAQGYISQE
jgi:hypothetical protein